LIHKDVLLDLICYSIICLLLANIFFSYLHTTFIIMTSLGSFQSAFLFIGNICVTKFFFLLRLLFLHLFPLPFNFFLHNIRYHNETPSLIFAKNVVILCIISHANASNKFYFTMVIASNHLVSKQYEFIIQNTPQLYPSFCEIWTILTLNYLLLIPLEIS